MANPRLVKAHGPWKSAYGYERRTYFMRRKIYVHFSPVSLFYRRRLFTFTLMYETDLMLIHNEIILHIALKSYKLHIKNTKKDLKPCLQSRLEKGHILSWHFY